jgi:hypothetical protein
MFSFLFGVFLSLRGSPFSSMFSFLFDVLISLRLFWKQGERKLGLLFSRLERLELLRPPTATE